MKAVITKLLKAAIRRLFNLAGLEIQRINPDSDDALPRESVLHALEQARP